MKNAPGQLTEELLAKENVLRRLQFVLPVHVSGVLRYTRELADGSGHKLLLVPLYHYLAKPAFDFNIRFPGKHKKMVGCYNFLHVSSSWKLLFKYKIRS